MNIFTQFFKGGARNNDARNADIQKDLMRREADLNKTLFGPIPDGVIRDFFCLDRNTWIWYEEWVDNSGHTQMVTTRYVVRPTEILKSRNGSAYQRLTLEEARNFQKATSKYSEKVQTELYATN